MYSWIVFFIHIIIWWRQFHFTTCHGQNIGHRVWSWENQFQYSFIKFILFSNYICSASSGCIHYHHKAMYCRRFEFRPIANMLHIVKLILTMTKNAHDQKRCLRAEMASTWPIFFLLSIFSLQNTWVHNSMVVLSNLWK